MGKDVGGCEAVGLARGRQSSGPLLIPASPVGSQGRRSHVWDPGGSRPAWTPIAERTGAGRHGDISQNREEQVRSLLGSKTATGALESRDLCRGKGHHVTAFSWTCTSVARPGEGV